MAHARTVGGTPCVFADLRMLGLEPVVVAGRAPDRRAYLLRPDLGRALDEVSATRLARSCDPPLALVIADGLSATAVQRHAAPFLAASLPRLARIGVAEDRR